MYFSRVALALSLVCIAGARTARAETSTVADTADPQHVIAAYHAALVAHDGTRLAALFLPTGSAWFSVLSDDAWSRAKARNPNAAKLRPGSVQDFARLVSSSKADLDAQHSDLQLQDDGALCTATFRFRFLISGREENRGSESWQMVKTAEGWRIASLVYSSNPSPAE